MTTLNPEHLNTAAVAYRESEIVNGSGSFHDNVEAAILAYRDAADRDDEFASSTAVLGIGDEQMKSIEDAIEQRLSGNGVLREKARKFFDHALCEMLDGFESHFANDTRWNLDRLVVDKAKLLVDAILRGDEKVMESFAGRSWNGPTRKAVLDAIGDYAARAEVDRLREQVKSLEESLKYRGGY